MHRTGINILTDIGDIDDIAERSMAADLLEDYIEKMRAGPRKAMWRLNQGMLISGLSLEQDRMTTLNFQIGCLVKEITDYHMSAPLTIDDISLGDAYFKRWENNIESAIVDDYRGYIEVVRSCKLLPEKCVPGYSIDMQMRICMDSPLSCLCIIHLKRNVRVSMMAEKTRLEMMLVPSRRG